jgi:hypothetical protein
MKTNYPRNTRMTLSFAGRELLMEFVCFRLMFAIGGSQWTAVQRFASAERGDEPENYQ